MADKFTTSAQEFMNDKDLIVDENFETELIKNAVLKLNGTILGIVLGMVLGLLIFAATIWLVMKGGANVGAHLNLLSQFFIGYSVTFAGSLIGFVYGFITGFVCGFLIAWIYNKVVFLKRL